MTRRNAIVVRLLFDRKNGVKQIERLDRLMIQYGSIEKVKDVLEGHFNKQIRKTDTPCWMWTFIPLGFILIGFGLGMEDQIYKFIFIPLGMLCILLLVILLIVRKKMLIDLLKQTRSKIRKKTNGMLQMSRYYTFQVLLCSNQVKCCAKLTHFIFRIRKKEGQEADIEKQNLKDPSKFIPANARQEISVMNTTEYNKMS